MPPMKSTARYVFSVSILSAILYLFDANDVLATMASADIETVSIAVGCASFRGVTLSLNDRY